MQRFVCLEDVGSIQFLLKKFVDNIEIVDYCPDLKITKEDIIITNYMSYRFKNPNRYITRNFHIEYVLSKYENKIICDDVDEPDKKIEHVSKNYKTYHKNVLYFSYTGNLKDKPDNLIYVPNSWWILSHLHFKHLPSLNETYRYIPNKTFDKKFLMPIRRESKWRKEILESVSEFLQDAIYSANWLGINLPNDGIHKQDFY